MRSLRALLSFALLIPGTAALAGSGLTWSTVQKTVTTKPGQERLSVDFAFSNTGSAPVNLSDLDTGCACTRAHADPTIVRPGGRGVVHVDVDLAQLTGTREESVDVYVNGSRTAPDELHLRVVVPETYRMTPTVLVWKVGEAPVRRTLRLEPTEGNTLHVIRVSAVVGDVRSSVDAVADGKSYEIWVQPTNTHQTATVPIQIELSIDGLAPVTVRAYAVISD